METAELNRGVSQSQDHLWIPELNSKYSPSNSQKCISALRKKQSSFESSPETKKKNVSFKTVNQVFTVECYKRHNKNPKFYSDEDEHFTCNVPSCGIF